MKVPNREEAMALARPLLDALDHLHRNGVVHQDIKPANNFITRKGEPVLIDFGAAETSTGKQRGSEGYAAPEQSRAGAALGPGTDS